MQIPTYTTGLPPGIIASCIKSIDIIKKNKKLIKPLENAIYFSRLLERKLPVSPIVPIIIGDEKTLTISKLLYKKVF